MHLLLVMFLASVGHPIVGIIVGVAAGKGCCCRPTWFGGLRCDGQSQKAKAQKPWPKPKPSWACLFGFPSQITKNSKCEPGRDKNMKAGRQQRQQEQQQQRNNSNMTGNSPSLAPALGLPKRYVANYFRKSSY